MSSMMKQLLGGMKWTASSTVINTILQLVQYIVLARLLSPSDFGLMGMIIVIISFAQIFTDMGIGSAIIQRKNVTEQQLSTLYWFNILSGVIVFLTVFATSPLVASFYKEDRLIGPLYLTAFVFLVIPFGQQFQYLLQKNLEFDKLAKIEVVSIAFGVLGSILIAVFDYGVYALVWGQIISNFAKSLLLGIYGWKSWRPKFHFNKDDLKGFLSFGFYQMGSRTVSFFGSNIDNMLIGRFLGAEALGIYTIAYQLIIIPVTKINPIITKVAFPLFSIQQDNNKDISKAFIDMSKLLAVITFPMLVGLMSTAPILIPILFGTKWELSIPIVQVLAILGILRVLMNPNGAVLLAKGRADLGFKWDFFVAITNAIVFMFVIPYGVLGVAWSRVIISIVNLFLGRLLLRSVIGLKARDYFAALLKPTLISIIMGSIVYTAYLITSHFLNVINIYYLIGFILIGVFAYVLFFYLIDRHYILSVKNLMKQKGMTV
jgi:O-antigen/teichoic acid export membrane protein